MGTVKLQQTQESVWAALNRREKGIQK